MIFLNYGMASYKDRKLKNVERTVNQCALSMHTKANHLLPIQQDPLLNSSEPLRGHEVIKFPLL